MEGFNQRFGSVRLFSFGHGSTGNVLGLLADVVSGLFKNCSSPGRSNPQVRE
jgi:hypothetical protein